MLLLIPPTAAGALTGEDLTLATHAASFSPGTVSADDAQAPRLVTLAVGPSDARADPLSLVPFDRLVILAPPGFTYDIVGARVGATVVRNATSLVAPHECTFDMTNPGVVAWSLPSVQGQNIGRLSYYTCTRGGASVLTLSNPVVGETLHVDLAAFRAPTVAANHSFTIILAPTLAGADDLVGLEGALDETGLRVDASFLVTPGLATSLELSGAPAEAVAGTPLRGAPGARLNVTVRDAHGNVKTDHAGPLTFTSSDARAALPEGEVFAQEGNRSFALELFTLKTTGAHTLTASAGPALEDTVGLTVAPGALATFALDCNTLSATVGANASCEVSAGADAFANDAPIGTVTWSATDVEANVVPIEAGDLRLPERPELGPILVRAEAGGITREQSIQLNAGALDHVTFTQAPASTDADTPVTFRAEARDAFENPLPTTVTYDLVIGDGGIERATGTFTPRLVGTTTVRAQAGDKVATASIAVTQGALHHLTFTQAPETTDADTGVTFTAQPRDQHDNPRADPVAYAIASGAGAIDGEDGSYVPRATGTDVIQATSGAVTSTATISVRAGALHHVTFTRAPGTTTADDAVEFAAEPRDQHDNLRTDTLSWTVVSGGGSIDSTGRYTPGTTGTTTLRAAAGTHEALTTITVTQGALTRIVFDHAPETTDADTPVTFRARAIDAQGNTRSDVVTFELAGGPGALTPEGAFTPDRAGTATVRATAGGAAASRGILVTPGALHHVAFTLAPAATTADDIVAFAAEARDQHDNARADAVTYTVLAGSGDITSAGAFTPARAGTTTVQAEVGASRATASIDVTPGALHHVTFTLAPETTTADTPVTFAAQARDQRDNPRPADAITYTVADGAGAISSEGLFAPGLAGNSTIRASAGAVHALASIRVEAGALHHVAFTRAPATTDADTPVRFIAQAEDVHGNAREEVVTFHLASGSGLLDEASGLFTPSLAGPAIVRAETAALSATTTIHVEAGAPSRIAFHAPPAHTDADTPVGLVAKIVDQHGNARRDEISYALVSGPGRIDAATGTFSSDLVGVSTVRASARGLSTSHQLEVRPGALTQMRFILAPEETTADASVTFVARAYDAHGNARDDPPTFSLAGGTGSVNATSGVFTPHRAGTSVIRASVGSVGVTTNLRVAPGAPAALSFVAAPANVTADGQATFIARASDARGNERSDPISYTVFAGSGVIDARSGVFTPDKVGTTRIVAVSGSLAAMSEITVAHGIARSLALESAPADILAGSPFTVKVHLVDARQNVVTNATPAVRLAIAQGPPGATLLGPDQVEMKSGRAVFEGVSIATTGSHVLTAATDALPPLQLTIHLRAAAGTPDAPAQPPASPAPPPSAAPPAPPPATDEPATTDASASTNTTSSDPPAASPTEGEETEAAPPEPAVEPGRLSVRAPARVAPGSPFTIEVAATDAQGTPLAQSVPLTIVLRDAAGNFVRTMTVALHDGSASAPDLVLATSGTFVATISGAGLDTASVTLTVEPAEATPPSPESTPETDLEETSRGSAVAGAAPANTPGPGIWMMLLAVGAALQLARGPRRRG